MEGKPGIDTTEAPLVHKVAISCLNMVGFASGPFIYGKKKQQHGFLQCHVTRITSASGKVPVRSPSKMHNVLVADGFTLKVVHKTWKVTALRQPDRLDRWLFSRHIYFGLWFEAYRTPKS